LNKKVLIIRFNSIGDVVLTSPVAEILNAKGYEVHYLIKSSFSSLLYSNPNIYKVWELKENLNEIIGYLKFENFDFIVDLHNNLRSLKVRAALKVKSFSLKKPRLKYFLLTKFGIKLKPEPHIVHRFLKVVEPLVGKVNNPKTNFYFNDKNKQALLNTLPEKYITIAVGAAFVTKTILPEKLIEFIKRSGKQIVLIGGEKDVEAAHFIQEKSDEFVINLVGLLSISDSAHIIKNSELLLSGDTGMMHIGAALNIPMVNVFGSTHSILGYTPFYGDKGNKSSIIENKTLACRPCTKQGNKSCPKGHFKCMKSISVDQMLKVIQ